MAFTVDACTQIVTSQVVVSFRDLCLPSTTFTAGYKVKGDLKILHPTLDDDDVSYRLTDGKGSFFVNAPTVQTWNIYTPYTGLQDCTTGGCTLKVLKTCSLPANLDTAYNPNTTGSVNRALPVAGTFYRLSLYVGERWFIHDFTINAAVTYPDFCGGIALAELVKDSDPLLDSGCTAASQLALATYIAAQI